MINNMRLELLKINQDRLAKKEQAEAELFQKDYDRMEKRVEVTTLKEQILEEMEEYKRDLDL